MTSANPPGRYETQVELPKVERPVLRAQLQSFKNDRRGKYGKVMEHAIGLAGDDMTKQQTWPNGRIYGFTDEVMSLKHCNFLDFVG